MQEEGQAMHETGLLSIDAEKFPGRALNRVRGFAFHGVS
jgi:hypothetical protein